MRRITMLTISILVLAKRLIKDFPGSLDGTPAILPANEMALRRRARALARLAPG
jgi:hypothetical protein